jgi:hypothetical protein
MFAEWANRLVLYVPMATGLWGSTAFLIAPTQWMVIWLSVVCGMSLGVLVSVLLSVSSRS